MGTTVKPGEISPEARPKPDKTATPLRWKPRQKIGTVDVPLSSRRGKGERHSSGWGILPPALLRLVINHALSDYPIDPIMRRQFACSTQATAVLEAVVKRGWMYKLRLVNAAWKRTVDDHPFWATLQPLLNPDPKPPKPDRRDGKADNRASEARGSRGGSRTRHQESPYHVARRICYGVCIPCRINFPSARHTSTAYSDEQLPVKIIGWVGVCEPHHHSFCTGCLVSINAAHHRGESIPLDIIEPADGDTDEFGHRLHDTAFTCRTCRAAALDTAIERLLVVRARGGVVRGRAQDHHADLDYDEYIRGDTGYTALGTAERLLDLRSLMGLDGGRSIDGPREPGGRYLARDETVFRLRKMNLEAKLRYLYNRPAENHSQREKRWAALKELSPWQDMHVGRDQSEQSQLQREWSLEASYRGLERVIEDTREHWKRETLDDNYMQILRDTLITDFILERIRLGIWVLPSKEIELIRHFPAALEKAPSTSIGAPPHPYCPEKHMRQVLISTTHPLLGSRTVQTSAGLKRASGQFCLVRGIRDGPDWPEPVLPSHEMVQQMDARFIEWFTKLVSPALARMAAELVASVGDDMKAEALGERMCVRDVLHELRKSESWSRIPRSVDMSKRARPNGPKMRRTQPAHGEEDSDIGGEASSPRVELVANEEVDQPILADYGIKAEVLYSSDSPSSVAAGDDLDDATVPESLRTDATAVKATVVSVTEAAPTSQLGKRKTPPAELASRSAKGSREMSTSTEGDDVLMPITPEEEAMVTLGSVLALKGRDATGLDESPVLTPQIVNPTRLPATSTALSMGKEGQSIDINDGDIADGRDTDQNSPTHTSAGSGSDDDDIGRDENGHYDTGMMLADPDDVNEVEELDDEYVLTDPDEPDAEEYEDESDLSEPTPSPPAVHLIDGNPDHAQAKSSTTPSSNLFLPFEYIPSVPIPATDDPDDPVARVLAKDLIMRLWYEARQPLRDCSCGICLRQKHAVTADVMKLFFMG